MRHHRDYRQRAPPGDPAVPYSSGCLQLRRQGQGVGVREAVQPPGPPVGITRRPSQDESQHVLPRGVPLAEQDLIIYRCY
jgi:hypothetical protein